MITLIIKEKGHLIEIPGMTPFRTPAKVDISKGDIRTIVGYLKVCSINDYEIFATNQGNTEKYSAKDFNPDKPKKAVKKKVVKPDKKLNERMDRMEKMIEKLYENSENDSGKKVEQKTNQTEMFQKQILETLKHLGKGGVDGTETDIEEEEDVAPFIPEIDVEGMKLNTQGNTKTIKKDREDTDDAADALSKILK